LRSINLLYEGEKVIANKKQVDYSQIYFNLNADIEDDDVIVCDVSQKQPGTYVKVCELLTMSYSLWSNYEEKYHKKMENYKDRLREYNFSTITITDVPIDIATDIFTRLNVGGKKLSPFEIMSAKAYDDVIGFDLSVKYAEMIEKWKQCGYNTLPSSILLQALSICICGESGRKHILSLEKTDIINNWDIVCAAFDTAIDYFKNYFRIPVSKLIPYEGLLVPFVYFFFRHPKNPDANHECNKVFNREIYNFLICCEFGKNSLSCSAIFV